MDWNKHLEIVASPDGSHLLFSSLDGSACVVKAGSWRLLGVFPSIYDFGGCRLAIANDADLIAIGSYSRGIGMYDVDGHLLWVRKDLKKCSCPAFSSDNSALCCPIYGRGTHVLNVLNGDTVDRLRGVRGVWEGKQDSARVCVFKKHLVVTRLHSENNLNIPIESFAVGDCLVANNALYFSEIGSALKCIDLETESERWRYQDHHWHALNLAISSDSVSLKVLWYCYEKHLDTRVLTLNCATGEITSDISVPRAAAYAFCLDGSCVVATNGHVYNCSTGETVERIVLPRK
jgi:hypothetical protein